jgi:hypothetical protein
MVKARWRTGWRETMNLVESLNERDRLRQERAAFLLALEKIAATERRNLTPNNRLAIIYELAAAALDIAKAKGNATA